MSHALGVGTVNVSHGSLDSGTISSDNAREDTCWTSGVIVSLSSADVDIGRGVAPNA